MGSLDDLKKKIYQPGTGTELEERVKKDPDKPQKKEKKWEIQESRYDITPKKILFVVVLVSFVLIGFGIYQWARFRPEKIQMEIHGLSQAPGGKKLNMQVRLKNNNRQRLEDATLTIHYPPLTYSIEDQAYKESHTLSLGDIEPGQEINITKEIRLLAAPFEEVTTRAELSFRVEKKSTRKETSLTSQITSSPIKITIRKPRRLVQGQSALYEIYYSNTGDFDFPQSRLRLNIPEEIKITHSSLESISENTWSLGKIPAGQDGKITLALTPLEPLPSAQIQATIESKFKNRFSYYADTSASQEVLPPPLAIKQSTNKVAIQWDAGQMVTAKEKRQIVQALDQRKNMELTPVQTIKEDFLGGIIKVMLEIENTTETTFQDIKISASPKGELFNQDWVIAERLGEVSEDKDTITWKKEKMLPQEKDSFGFYIELKERLPLAVFKDNNSLRVESKIETDSTPVGWEGIKTGSESLAALKLETTPNIEAKIASRESPLYSAGPIPPVVKKETTYPIAWEISNSYNNLTDCTIKAELPDYIRWAKSYFPSEEDIKYNEITNEVVWQVPEVSYGTGRISEPRRAFFQINFTPAEDQYGQFVPLVKETKLSCQDEFTEKTIQKQADQVETSSRIAR